MGLFFYASAYSVPDDKFKALQQHRSKITKRDKRKLTKRRRQQLDGIVQEARAWMYALLIPTRIIANGDTKIEKRLDGQIEDITSLLLGSKIDQKKVNAVCGKIARNILAPGTRNIDKDDSYHPPKRARYDYEVLHLLDHKFIQASCLQSIYDNCYGFKSSHPDERTWDEIRELAENHQYLISRFSSTEPLTDFVNRCQGIMTKAELGLPYYVDQGFIRKKDLIRKEDLYVPMESRDPLKSYSREQHDLIIVRADKITDPMLPKRVAAQMDKDTNTMILYPEFFDPVYNSITDFPLVPTKDEGEEELLYSLHYIDTRIGTLLHEITHSEDVLDTDDHTFNYSENFIDLIPYFLRHPTPAFDGTYKAYGIESCMALARRDRLHNTNKAEDNADSWALYFTIRILLLAYPDLDIFGALQAGSGNRCMPQIREVQKRDELLHHCSFLSPLRYVTPEDLRLSQGTDTCPGRDQMIQGSLYDPSKEFWSEYARSCGRRIPKTVEDMVRLGQDYDYLTLNDAWDPDDED